MGITFDRERQRFQFDFEHDGTSDLVTLTGSGYQVEAFGKCFYYGYEFEPEIDSDTRTKFIQYVKFPPSIQKDENLSHFIQKAINDLNAKINLYDYDLVIYPESSSQVNVPSNISLRLLSELIIDLMGWEGSHLNQFRKTNDYYAPAYQREDEMPVFFGPARNHNQEDFAISDILHDKGKSMEWEYDFGDSWLHEVRLSSIGEYTEGEAPISFVKGERACPPEDCGGIWGYEELLEMRERWLKYTAHAGKRPSRDELDRLEWYDMNGDFDPEEFDTDEAREICEDFCK